MAQQFLALGAIVPRAAKPRGRSLTARLGLRADKERAYWLSVNASTSSGGDYVEIWRSNVISMPAAVLAEEGSGGGSESVVMTTPCDIAALAAAAAAAAAAGTAGLANASFVVALHLGAQGAATSLMLDMGGGGGADGGGGGGWSLRISTPNSGIIAYTTTTLDELRALFSGESSAPSAAFPIALPFQLVKPEQYTADSGGSGEGQGEGQGGGRRASLLLWPLNGSDPFAGCKSVMGGLCAAETPQNPFHVLYVVKRDQKDASAASIVVATESAFEVSFTFKLPTLFLSPVVRALDDAADAWQAMCSRAAAARGAFDDDDSALSRGMVAVRVTVVRARRLKPLRKFTPLKHRSGTTGGGGGDDDDGDGARESSHGRGRGGSGGRSGSGDEDDEDEDDEDDDDGSVGGGGGGGGDSADGRENGSAKREPTTTTTMTTTSAVAKMKAVVSGTPKSSTSSKGSSAGSRVKSVLSSAAMRLESFKATSGLIGTGASEPPEEPSTFAEVLYEAPKHQLHARAVGRTNTEYHASSPVYGSNAHRHHCPHNRPALSFAAVGTAALEVAELRSDPVNGGSLGGSHGVEPVPLPTTLAFYVPEEEVPGALLHLRIMEERVVGSGAKRSNEAAVLATLSLPLQQSARNSQGAPKPAGRSSGQSSGQPLARPCWYALQGSGGDAEVLVSVELTESEEEAPEEGGGGGDGADWGSKSMERRRRQRYLREDQASAERAMRGFLAVTSLLGLPPSPLVTMALEDQARFDTPSGDASGGVAMEPSLLTSLAAVIAAEAANPKKDTANDGNVAVGPRLPSRLLPVRWGLTWCANHAGHLRRDATVLRSSVDTIDSLHSRGKSFRGSKLKKSVELQGVATNLHVQLFNVHETAADGRMNPNAGKAVGEGGEGGMLFGAYDVVTHGAPTVHAFGFDRGGLSSLEVALANTHSELSDALRRYKELRDEHLRWLAKTVELDFEQLLSEPPVPVTGSAVAAPSPPKKSDASKESIWASASVVDTSGEATTAMSPGCEASLLLGRISQLSMQYEGRAAEIGLRRAVAMSQAVSIAAASLAAKVMLARRQYVYAAASAERWVRHGFLLYMEGLISTKGKELGMIQDCAAVTELLSQWSVIVAPSPEGAKGGGTVDVDVDVSGRTIRLLVDQASFDALPACLRSSGEGARLRLVPVLFIQGVDIQQTLANRSRSRSGPRFQMEVNRKNFANINAYCHRCHPVGEGDGGADQDRNAAGPVTSLYGGYRQQGSGEAAEGAGEGGTSNGNDEQAQQSTGQLDGLGVHPLCAALATAIRNESVKEKNVEILEEAARVTYALGGGQTVFCKSGKDRTAMCVTLQQSKALGEKHGCGNTTERVCATANHMRSMGARMGIAHKNIGSYKYSFNPLQVSFLPAEWRPPSHTVQDFTTSVIKRDS